MASPEGKSPYVVTADGHELLHAWGKQRGIKTPSSRYFEDYTSDLLAMLAQSTDAPVEVVDHDELQEGLALLVSRSRLPVISLDRAYTDGMHNLAGYIDATRAVDPDYNDIPLSNRPGTPHLEAQIKEFRTSEIAPVTVMEDVVFSGGTILKLNELLTEAGRPIRSVIAGVAIQKGVKALEDAGIAVEHVRFYPEVEDEVCQRDFLACMPYSGRTIVDGQDVWSAPYFWPFGDPEVWASIKGEDRIRAFSRFCLGRSLDLWDEVSNISGINVSTIEVPRPLKGMAGRIEPVTHFLNRHLRQVIETEPIKEEVYG